MNTIASMLCERPNPDTGWPCIRKRGHVGEHIAHDDHGQDRRAWRDPKALQLDEETEGVSLEPITLEPVLTSSNAVLLMVLLLLVVCSPAIVAGVYRWGF